MPDTPSESATLQALQLENEQIRAQLRESEATCHTQTQRIEELEREVASQEEFLHTMLDNFPGGVAIYRTLAETTEAPLVEFKYYSRDWITLWHRSEDDSFLAEYKENRSAVEDIRNYFEESHAWRNYNLIKKREDETNPLQKARAVLESRGKGGDGSEFWVRTIAHAIEHQGERWNLGYFQDITEQVEAQKTLEAANELMTMGIGYGSRIQQAILPRTEEIRAAFRAFEVSWEPRDVVSGDFYWFHREGAKSWLMLGDCTGHGVPGAFMSLISLTVLDRIAYEGRLTDPAGMLRELGLLLRKSLGLDRPDAETDDGLDAAFCCFDSEAGTVTYSGKILPLYRLRGGELEVIKGERGSVGYHTPNDEKPFTNHTLELREGDRFVLISDGFVDQVCETTGRMYGPKRFRKKLADHADLAVPELMRALLDDHAAEQSAHTRRDDLTLMALEV